MSSGRITWSFAETNGPTITFYYLTGEVLFIPGLFSCTGNVATCDPDSVGHTPGSTETGQVNGNFNPLPQIQATITASSYGASAEPRLR